VVILFSSVALINQSIVLKIGKEYQALKIYSDLAILGDQVQGCSYGCYSHNEKENVAETILYLL